MLQQILHFDGHIQSIYLAIYTDKLLLLDGCCRADVPLVLDVIVKLLGRKPEDLKGVVVTHMHADHAGGAAELRKETGCQIISADKPEQWYTGFSGHVNYLLDLSLAYVVAHHKGKKLQNLNYPIKLHPDIKLNDGDRIPMFDDWQVLETAGHTDRDLSLYHRQTGKVYIADLVVKIKRNRYVPPYNIHNPEAYIHSVIKIKNLKPTLVMMAHGGQSCIKECVFDTLIANSPTISRTNLDAYRKIVFKFSLVKRKKKSKTKK